MKKVKGIFKNNIKLIIGIIIGGVVFGTLGVYAATVLAASQVSYTKNSQSTVDGALDTLFTRASKMDTYKDLQCPGCVYRKSTTKKYNVNSTSSSKTDANSKLSSSEYKTDYTELNSNYFLGHVIDESGYILSSYVCGINNGTFFCLRGVDSTQSSLTYKPFYQENINRMNKAIPSCDATTAGSIAYCSGGNTYVYSDGYVYVSSGTNKCNAYPDGTSYCN